jgi:hypothetical protein
MWPNSWSQQKIAEEVEYAFIIKYHVMMVNLKGQLPRVLRLDFTIEMVLVITFSL